MKGEKKERGARKGGCIKSRARVKIQICKEGMKERVQEAKIEKII